MKKKVLSIILAVCLAAGGAAVPGGTAAAAEIEQDVKAAEDALEWGYEELDDGTVAVSEYKGTATEVTIPAALGGKQVTVIGGNWEFDGVFYENETVTKVTIPEGVKTIGDSTFMFCKSLTQVDIPSTVTTIEDYAFCGCESLAGVTLPEALTSIGDSAFSGCYNAEETKGLTGIAIPAKVAHIGEGAFGDNQKLTKIEVAEGNAAYASVDGVLFNKARTELITYPAGNPALKYQLPNTVQKIGKNAFDGAKITEVTLPSSLREIGEYAFSGLALTAVTLPAGLTTIANYAFWLCDLVEVTIPASVTGIGEKAFSNAVLQVDAANTTYASADGILYNKAKTELLYYPGSKKGTAYTIPEGVSEVGAYAFYDTVDLTSIIVPKHVTKLKGYSLYNSSIEEVTIQNPQCVFDAGEDNVDPVFSSYTKIRGHANSTAQEYARINENAFEVIPDACTQHSYEEQITKAPTCAQKGEKKYTCKNCGESYTEEVPQTGHTNETERTPASPGKNGSVTVKCSVCGEVAENRTISAPKTVTISKSTLTYNGKAQKVAVTVKDSAGKTIPASSYSVSFGNNKNVGEAAATVTFSGDYTGSMKKTFRILPKGTSLSKVTAKKKGFTVKWKKQASQTTGYEIQYSTSSKFKGAKTAGNIKAKTTSKSINKLKAKKKYYVRIRTYKTAKINGKNTKLCSAWSKAKTVTTKK